MVRRRAGHLRAEGDKLDVCQYLEWELDMGPVTLREFKHMVRKDFAGIPDLHSPVNEEVGPALLYDSLPHLQYQPITLERATFYVAAQRPLRAIAPSYNISPPDTSSPSYLTLPYASFVSSPTSAAIEDLSANVTSASSSPNHP